MCCLYPPSSRHGGTAEGQARKIESTLKKSVFLYPFSNSSICYHQPMTYTPEGKAFEKKISRLLFITSKRLGIQLSFQTEKPGYRKIAIQIDARKQDHIQTFKDVIKNIYSGLTEVDQDIFITYEFLVSYKEEFEKFTTEDALVS
jgi:hypothetical protein